MALTPAHSTAAPRLPVAILGAGLTGMSAAYHLREAGVRQRLFEKLDRPGGHAVTVAERGYRFDRTGHLLHAKDPAIQELALRWIGPEHRWIERRSRVWSHGRYTRYPFQANVHGLPPEVAYACVMGFIEAQRRGQEGEVRNFEEFCRARFGDGISEHFMIPYNTRLWGVPPREISAAWCQRFVPIPKLEDVIAGAVGMEDRELGYNARFLYPKHGIGQLSDGLAADLADGAGAGVELQRSVEVIDLQRRELVFEDERVAYETLISTAPLPVLLRLCNVLPAEVEAAAGKLRCTHLHYLDVALRGACGKPFHWVYVPEEKYPFYRVGCYSHFSPQMAPPGDACLYVELVDREEPNLGAVLPQVADALIEMGIIARREAIVFARLRKIDHAYVIFDHHYEEARATVQEFLNKQGIVSAGRYGDWNYSSMGDALRFGREAAVRAQQQLGAGA